MSTNPRLLGDRKQRSKRENTVTELDDMSYNFSRYFRIPSRHIVLAGGILSGLVYTYFALYPYLVTLVCHAWHRGPLCIDAPRLEDSKCHPRNLCIPQLPGVSILKMTAAEVHNYSINHSPVWNENSNKSSYFAPSFDPISFCNVTVTYTHPGFDDEIHVSLHLPPKHAWNGRFQGSGGGGFLVSLGNLALFGPVARGFAVANTDGGIPTGDPSDWALASPGNINLNTLHTYGSTALADMTVIGQQLTHRYYGKRPSYSYWNGCSTGGRQGIQLAQSHPHLYDGILAAAPAVHMPRLGTSMYWPQILMQEMESWVQPCELQALTSAAVLTCDGLDGVVDGIISAPDKCKAKFNPFDFVHSSVPCPSRPAQNITISTTAAKLASAIWSGPRTGNGYELFHPLLHQANLDSLARTTCSEPSSMQNKLKCRGLPQILPSQWIQLFLLRKHFPSSTTVLGAMSKRYMASADSDPYADLFALTREQYDDLFAMADREYKGIVGSDNPDLSQFARMGGKIITWHGLADDLIPPGGSIEYYEAVLKHFKKYEKSYQGRGTQDKSADTYPLSNQGDLKGAGAKSPQSVSNSVPEVIDNVAGFYRLYLAPGVSHCLGGPGPYPGHAWDSHGALDQLMAWVENGTTPETLSAVSDGDAEEKRIRRPLCVWPRIANYRGRKGKEMEAEGWVCEDGEY